jgi:septal ring factor EnvC (AmiA/AmiB activator)
VLLTPGAPVPSAQTPPGDQGGPQGEPSKEESARLQSIRQEIEALRARLLRGESEAGTLLETLDDLDLKMALLRRESTLIEADIAATRRAAERARVQAESARGRVAAAERDLRRYLVELYKTGPARDLRLAFASSSPAHLATAARAAEILTREEGRRVGTLRTERERLDAAAVELEGTRARQEALAADLQHRQSDLRATRSSQNALLDNIKAQQARGEEALMALVQAERDLQSLLGTLGSSQGGRVASYGLPRLRGLLNWPARGPVAIPFGNVRHPRFGTQVPHPGIDIACDPGETVRALFDGRVVFSSWFKGYGQMIVIDHGDEYLSIYGQLGERLVEAGQEVRRDEPIARSGDQGTFGITGLYLEVRHAGQAEDPLLWLRRNTGRATAREEKRR